MDEIQAQPSNEPTDARCAEHPDRPATAICTRCGRFVCAEDERQIDRKTVCAHCAARPESDPVEGFRLDHWGKPDIWAWLVGVSMLPQLWIVWDAARHPDRRLWFAGNAFFLIVDAGYFLGKRWARYAICLSALMTFADPHPSPIWVRIATAAIFAGILAGMWADVRNQLFFRIEVPRVRLERAQRTYASNRIALASVVMSCIGLVVPGLSFAAIPMAITALIRRRTGKVQRQNLTVAAVIASLGISLLWTGLYFALLAFAKSMGIDPKTGKPIH